VFETARKEGKLDWRQHMGDSVQCPAMIQELAEKIVQLPSQEVKDVLRLGLDPDSWRDEKERDGDRAFQEKKLQCIKTLLEATFKSLGFHCESGPAASGGVTQNNVARAAASKCLALMHQVVTHPFDRC